MDNDYDTKLARQAFTIYEAMAKLAKEIRRATPLFVIYESLAKSVYGDMSQVTDEVIMQELGFTETDILRIAERMLRPTTFFIKKNIYAEVGIENSIWSDRITDIIARILTANDYTPDKGAWKSNTDIPLPKKRWYKSKNKVDAADDADDADDADAEANET